MVWIELFFPSYVSSLHLQAFVFFPDWTTCCDFVQDHVTNPVSVMGHKLSVHFVLQHMNHESSEVRTLGETLKGALWDQHEIEKSTWRHFRGK